MKHLDLPCISMLNEVLKGVELKRFEMETTAMGYLTQAEGMWLYQKNPAMLYSAADWSGEVFDTHAYGPDKVVKSQKIWVITHYEHEWKLIFSNGSLAYDELPQAMRNLRLDEKQIPDMILLNLDLYPPQARRARKGWLYDPKNHFWS
jgi:hypothetical protein